MAFVGQKFSTGNAVVKTLPKGAVLQVSGSGEVTILDIPKPAFNVKSLIPGQRFISKYGPATVVSLTSNKDGFPEGPLYIADGTTVVRVAREGKAL